MTALQVLGAMVRKNRPLSELTGSFERFPQVIGMEEMYIGRCLLIWQNCSANHLEPVCPAGDHHIQVV